MASKFYKDGKKLKGLNVVTDLDPTSASTSVYGETTFTQNIPKQKRLALMRIEADSKTGTYTATFGQPVEDVVNVINQLSTWVGDVEKAATVSTATQGVSTGRSEIYSQTYLGWVKVGTNEKYVSILGNQGNIKATGDVIIGGSFYSNGQIITGLQPVIRAYAISGFVGDAVQWRTTISKGYIEDHITYDDTKAQFTIVTPGYYMIDFRYYRTATTEGTVGIYVNGNVIDEHTHVLGYDAITILGVHLSKDDTLEFRFTGANADNWYMYESRLHMMVTPD